MQKKIDSFAQFGIVFQTKTLQALIIDQQFFEKTYGIMLNEYFDQEAHSNIYKIILEYYEKYKITPSVDNLEVSINLIQDHLLRESSLLVLEEIKKNSVSDLTYVKDKTLEFCRNQKMKKALLESVDYLQQGKFEDIYRTIKEALNAGEGSDIGHNYFEHFDKRILLMNRSTIPSGWKVLDRILNGGFGKGELAVIIAPTKIGKSWVLSYWGKGALDAGKTVLHYTFELYEHSVGARYDAIISGIPINQINTNQEIVRKRLGDYATKTNSKLIIKNYPTKTANIITLRNHINKLNHYGIIPDVIIVDYADLMNSKRNYEIKRFELESVYEDLRAMAGELQLPVLTASQVHRSSADDEVITLSAIAECYAKAQIADIIISLSRRYEDKRLNKGKLFIAGNRAGQDGIILPIIMNTTTAKMDVLEPEDINPMIEFSDNEASNDLLRKRYKEYKEKGA